MTSVWEFIKRNKGKLIAGGALAGGAYLAHRFYVEHRAAGEELERRAAEILDRLMPKSANNAGIGRGEGGESGTGDLLYGRNGHSSPRRNYIFDSNHRTCDDSIEHLLPTIKVGQLLFIAFKILVTFFVIVFIFLIRFSRESSRNLMLKAMRINWHCRALPI